MSEPTAAGWSRRAGRSGRATDRSREATTEERFRDLVDELARRDGVSLGSARRGFGSGTLQVEGRIFAMVSHGRVVLKLPASRVADLLASGEGVAFDAGKGRPMKEWVALADATHERWLALAREALAFVAGGVDRGAPKRPAGP